MDALCHLIIRNDVNFNSESVQACELNVSIAEKTFAMRANGRITIISLVYKWLFCIGGRLIGLHKFKS